MPVRWADMQSMERSASGRALVITTRLGGRAADEAPML